MIPIAIYNKYPISLVKGDGFWVEDHQGNNYMDFYGGHGVISIGHSHPHFVSELTKQLNQLAFYSNAFENPLQNKLAKLLGELTGYVNYQLFLSNSGAEANENALKVASLFNKRKKVLALKGAFHGRSAAAVSVTDNKSIRSEFSLHQQVDFIDVNDEKSLVEKLGTLDYAALIIEGIQGVNGVWEANTDFWKLARLLCSRTDTLLIADEIQSGFGRSGKFFAHQHHQVVVDIVTTAKGMGNGFPVGGTLIAPHIKLKKGMLGSTFGGGHLACVSANAVLEVIRENNLQQQAQVVGRFLKRELLKLKEVKAVRGRGLMLGIEFHVSAKAVQQELLEKHRIISGFSNPDVLRLLPPLSITQGACSLFINAIKMSAEKIRHDMYENSKNAING